MSAKIKQILLLLFCFCVPVCASTYYLAPGSQGGNDSNNGTSPSTPWLSPNHSVNCGDVITAAPSASYSETNFFSGNWGTVTCPAGNNVAWLICATFDACKISASGLDGMRITASYWGVQGWEATASGTYASCFSAAPAGTASVHHIIFANNIANGCSAGGFTTYNIGNASVDYIAVVGNIAYNAAQSGAFCYSGISIYQPIQSDALPGTHIYIAGNFSYKNLDPNPCSGGLPTDGEGIILDTLNGSSNGFSPYAQQVVVDNNILFLNGGRGLEVGGGGNSSATIVLRHNTVYGNNSDTNQNATWCGDVLLQSTSLTRSLYDLVATNSANGCGANPIYAFFVGYGNRTDHVSNSWGYSATGTNIGMASSIGFTYGPHNTIGTDPGFLSPSNPGAPNCGGASSVSNCMATVIANFIPQTSNAIAYGYQSPITTRTYDALFPQWLCNVNLPPRLVTMGCAALSSLPAAPSITSVTVQ
jgi:hypothetical protein